MTRNYNPLLGRYAGADGMKTGFICASGFNLVATATRDNKRLIAVVFGASSSAMRAAKAAQLLERGFQATPLSWLTPSLGTVDTLQPVDMQPPNLRDEMCGPHRKRPATEDEDPSLASLPSNSAYAVFMSSLRAPGQGSPLLQNAELGEPLVVYTGPQRPPGAPPLAVAVAKPGRAKPKLAVKPALATTTPVLSTEKTPGAAAKRRTPAAKTATQTKSSTAAPGKPTAPKTEAAPNTAAKATPGTAAKTAAKASPKASHATAAKKPKAEEKP